MQIDRGRWFAVATPEGISRHDKRMLVYGMFGRKIKHISLWLFSGSQWHQVKDVAIIFLSNRTVFICFYCARKHIRLLEQYLLNSIIYFPLSVEQHTALMFICVIVFYCQHLWTDCHDHKHTHTSYHRWKMNKGTFTFRPLINRRDKALYLADLKRHFWPLSPHFCCELDWEPLPGRLTATWRN